VNGDEEGELEKEYRACLARHCKEPSNLLLLDDAFQSLHQLFFVHLFVTFCLSKK
jgi:hypothetical protein